MNSDSDSDSDSENEDTLSQTYQKIKVPTSTTSSPKARAKTAVQKAKQLSALAKEAQQLRQDEHASNAAKTDFVDRAMAAGEGIVQFIEAGAPSPTFGTTSWISVAGWISQMVEVPEPGVGWGNVSEDYSGPETPVSDAFGAAGTTADLVCLVGALAKSIWNITRLHKDPDLTEEERNKRVISEACNIGTYVGHLGVAGIGIADMAYSGYVAAEKLTLTGEAVTNLETAAQQTGQHLSIATGVLGTVVGVYVTARNTRKAASAGIRMSKVQKLLKEADNVLDPAVDHEKALLQHLTFAEKKLRRKTFKSAFTATSALIGTGGSVGGLVVAAVGTTALANIWNPIGWSIFAAGLTVGLGVTTYMVVRHFTRKHRYEHRRTAKRPVNARIYAINLAEAYLDPAFKQNQKESWKYIKRLLNKTGVKDKKLKAYSQLSEAEGFRKLVKLIERKVT